MKNKIILLLSLLLAVLPCWGENPQVGVVTFCKGSASLIRGEEVRDLKVDELLLTNDVLKTGKNGKIRVILNLPGGSKSQTVGPDSEVAVSSMVSVNVQGKAKLGTVAREMIGMLVSTKVQTGQGIAAVRGPKLVDPGWLVDDACLLLTKGSHLAFPHRLMATPNEECDEYRFSVYKIDGELLFSGVSTSPAIILPDSIKEPGLRFSVKVGFRKGGETLQEVAREISLLGATASVQLRAELGDIEKSMDDDEDPTVFLLSGQEFLRQKCYSEAVLSFSQYCRTVPESKLGTAFLKKALNELDWLNPTDPEIESFLNVKPVLLAEQSDLLLLDE